MDPPVLYNPTVRQMKKEKNADSALYLCITALAESRIMLKYLNVFKSIYFNFYILSESGLTLKCLSKSLRSFLYFSVNNIQHLELSPSFARNHIVVRPHNLCLKPEFPPNGGKLKRQSSTENTNKNTKIEPN